MDEDITEDTKEGEDGEKEATVDDIFTDQTEDDILIAGDYFPALSELIEDAGPDPSETPPPEPNADRFNKFKKDKSKRRNIRPVLSETSVAQETMDAQRREQERLERIRLRQLQPSPPPPAPFLPRTASALLASNVVDLTISDDDDDVIVERNDVKMVKHEFGRHVYGASPVHLLESRRGTASRKRRQPRFMIDTRDPESNHHVSDLNFVETCGNMLINTKHPPEDADIFVPAHIAEIIKKHQLGGIRFMYDNVVESLNDFRTTDGFGCILAHSMGLGKTLQVITFVDICLRCVDAKHILIIVPINTLQNWVQEFEQWLPTDREDEGIKKRTFLVHVLNDKYKNKNDRVQLIKEWQKTTSVLLMGYEMYRILTRDLTTGPDRFKRKTPKQKRQAAMGVKECVDVEEDEVYDSVAAELRQALIDPGPDLIVCDEGHRIKNMQTGTAQALANIRTKRRVVLTGYPLQNNLSEYWCMVNFVRPDHLGSKAEFRRQFEIPIVNGLCNDSTPEDRALAKKRSYILSKKLSGFVQRRNHSHLMNELPKKTEFVVKVGKSEVQRRLYSHFFQYVCPNDDDAQDQVNPLTAFASCCKIWNHPDILDDALRSRDKAAARDMDLDLPDNNDETPPTKAVKARRKGANRNDSASPLPSTSKTKTGRTLTYNWARVVMNGYTAGDIENGYKMDLAMSIIDEATKNGDKILLFSQSLLTLDLIEKYLAAKKTFKMRTYGNNHIDYDWDRDRTYFRMDGGTGPSERQALIQRFNKDSAVHLFLISTKAGSLGINLVSANRVIVFDASWNPCHDAQAVCRIYRYGQKKRTYIYRFITHNSMENIIFNRQIGKQGLAEQVVDEQQVQPDVASDELRRLMQYDPQQDTEPVTWFNDKYDLEDDVFQTVCTRKGHMIVEMPFLHESLLLDEEELTADEKREAERDYEMEVQRRQTQNNIEDLARMQTAAAIAANTDACAAAGAAAGRRAGLFSHRIGLMADEGRVAVVRPIKGETQIRGPEWPGRGPWQPGPGPSWAPFPTETHPTSNIPPPPYPPYGYPNPPHPYPASQPLPPQHYQNGYGNGEHAMGSSSAPATQYRPEMSAAAGAMQFRPFNVQQQHQFNNGAPPSYTPTPATPRSLLPAQPMLPANYPQLENQREVVIKHTLATEACFLPSLTFPGTMFEVKVEQPMAIVKMGPRIYLRLPDKNLLDASGTSYERMIMNGGGDSLSSALPQPCNQNF